MEHEIFSNNLRELEKWEEENPSAKKLYIAFPDLKYSKIGRIIGVFIYIIVSLIAFVLVYSLILAIFQNPNTIVIGIITTLVLLLAGGGILYLFYTVGKSLIDYGNNIEGHYLSNEMYFHLKVDKKGNREIQTIDARDIIGIDAFHHYYAGEGSDKIAAKLLAMYKHDPRQRSSTWFLMKFDERDRFNQHFGMQYKKYRESSYEHPELISYVIDEFFMDQLRDALELNERCREMVHDLLGIPPDDQSPRSYCTNCFKDSAWGMTFCECGEELRRYGSFVKKDGHRYLHG